MLAIEINENEKAVIAYLKGEATIEECNKAIEIFKNIVDKRKNAVLDLSELSNIDAAFMQTIIAFKKEIKLNGFSFAFQNISPQLIRLLEIVGIEII
jgi:anti-anti-sigma factor